MDQLIKKNIRILSERYNHTVEYSANDIFINSKINSIKLSPRSKYGFDVEYNSDKETAKISTNLEDVYDILIEILRRTQLYKLRVKTGKLLDLNDWINEEGDSIRKEIKDLIVRLDNESIDYLNIGGNRYEGEYYRGLLILSDDLSLSKSNVLEIKNVANTIYIK